MTPPSVPATAGIGIRGGADDAEVAAVLAVLAGRSNTATVPDGYRRWRAGRLKALRSRTLRVSEE